MSAGDWLLLAVASAAALVQATIGIGFALIVAPVAALLRPDLLPGALILAMIPLNAWVAWDERASLELSGIGWITAGRVIGTGLGLGVLALLSARALNLLIGVSTLLAVAASLLAPRFRPGPPALAGAGLVTGVTETATGIGGPPLALVFQHHAPAALRANVALCFLIGEVLSVALLAASGALHRGQALAALTAMPPLALGIAGSGRARRLLDAALLRNLVLVIAAASSVWIIARG